MLVNIAMGLAARRLLYESERDANHPCQKLYPISGLGPRGARLERGGMDSSRSVVIGIILPEVPTVPYCLACPRRG